MKARYDFSRAKRGAIDPLPRGKSEIKFAVDDDVLDWFRAQTHTTNGGNYQALMNHALREYVSKHGENFEDVIRRVVRQELNVRNGRKTTRVATRKTA